MAMNQINFSFNPDNPFLSCDTNLLPLNTKMNPSEAELFNFDSISELPAELCYNDYTTTPSTQIQQNSPLLGVPSNSSSPISDFGSPSSQVPELLSSSPTFVTSNPSSPSDSESSLLLDNMECQQDINVLGLENSITDEYLDSILKEVNIDGFVIPVCDEDQERPKKRKRGQDGAITISPSNTLSSENLEAQTTSTFKPLSKEEILHISSSDFEAYQNRALMTYKLTKEQKKLLRSQRRLIKNREYAQQSRQKKKQHLSNLEQRIDILQEENQQLKKENSTLKTKIVKLVSMVKQLRNSATAAGNAVNKNLNATTGTFLFVLLLSFGLLFNFNTQNQLESPSSNSRHMTGRVILGAEDFNNSNNNNNNNNNRFPWFSSLFTFANKDKQDKGAHNSNQFTFTTIKTTTVTPKDSYSAPKIVEQTTITEDFELTDQIFQKLFNSSMHFHDAVAPSDQSIDIY